MTFTLDSFKEYATLLKTSKIEVIDNFLLVNIKEVVMFLLGKHKKFSLFLCRMFPVLFLDLIVYKSNHESDDRIKLVTAINKEKLMPQLKQWILDNYSVNEFLKEYDKVKARSGSIALVGTVIELNGTHEYRELMDIVVRERFSYKTISVVMNHDKVLVFFG